MATPVQEITITYAGFAVGGSSGRIVEAWHTFDISTEEAALEYSFIIPQTADSSALATAIAAAELAFNTPYSALTVVQSGSTLLSLSHSASTGFNSKPRIIKTESLADTGRSRRYVVRIVFGIPATNFGTSFRRSSSVKVTYDTSYKRHLVATAVYTANGATGAYAQAFSAGVTWAATVRSALTGNWEKLTYELERDDQDKVCTFVHTASELIFSDAGTTDDSSLVDGQLTISREQSAPGDFGSAKRLAILQLKYTSAVDWTVTPPTALPAKYDAVRQWMITQVQTTLGTGGLAIISETFTPNYTSNRLDVAMTVQGTQGGNIIEATFETEDFVEEGGVLVSLWTGNKFDKYLFQGPASYVRTETAIQVLLGNLSMTQLMAAGATGIGSTSKDAVVVGQEPGPQGLDNFIRVSKRPKVSHERRGRPGSGFDVTKITSVTITAWFTKPAAGGGNFATVDAHPEISGRRPGS